MANKKSTDEKRFYIRERKKTAYCRNLYGEKISIEKKVSAYYSRKRAKKRNNGTKSRLNWIGKLYDRTSKIINKQQFVTISLYNRLDVPFPFYSDFPFLFIFDIRHFFPLSLFSIALQSSSNMHSPRISKLSNRTITTMFAYKSDVCLVFSLSIFFLLALYLCSLIPFTALNNHSECN